jgi:hypothetical protein
MMKSVNRNTLNKKYLKSLLNSTRKEVKMSTKSLLRVVLSAGLLVVIFLGAEVVSNASSKGINSDSPMTDVRLAGSDYIERHPEIARNVNYYIGSDYIERHPEIAHPANYYLGADYSERHPQDPYAGSDWIERHPSQTTP